MAAKDVKFAGDARDKMLRGVEIFVSDKLSGDEAQRFARHFGGLLL